jgi:hypothetical protein
LDSWSGMIPGLRGFGPQLPILVQIKDLSILEYFIVQRLWGYGVPQSRTTVIKLNVILIEGWGDTSANCFSLVYPQLFSGDQYLYRYSMMRRMRFLCNKNGWFFPLKSGYLLIWIKVSVLIGSCEKFEKSPILFYRYDPWLEDSNLISYLFHSDPKHERVLATRIIYAEKQEDFITTWIRGLKGRVLSSLSCCAKMKPREVVRREFCLLLCVFVHVAPEAGGGHHGSGGAWAEIGHDLVVKTKSGPVSNFVIISSKNNFLCQKDIKRQMWSHEF